MHQVQAADPGEQLRRTARAGHLLRAGRLETGERVHRIGRDPALQGAVLFGLPGRGGDGGPVEAGCEGGERGDEDVAADFAGACQLPA
ncbi:hypothetical protein [Streptomyces coeruleorubidus]|uniref:hypothetical protein n=1 Tax=Streptomyces coeruleorubidus TaxID=116188 RepID=UPI00340C109E